MADDKRRNIVTTTVTDTELAEIEALRGSATVSSYVRDCVLNANTKKKKKLGGKQ